MVDRTVLDDEDHYEGKKPSKGDSVWVGDFYLTLMVRKGLPGKVTCEERF